MLIKHKKIAIIGGGPGGLTLARLLQLKDADVQVYERDADQAVRVQGATLDLHFESGLKAIETAGITEAFKKAYRPGADKGRVLDKYANIIYDEHERKNDPIDFGNADFRPEIDRGDLRDILLGALKPGTVVWDSQLISLSAAGDGWKLEFKNGTTSIVDMVIGADGAGSKIRPYVTPLSASYAGITIIQGNVADAAITAQRVHQLLKGGKIYVHSDDRYLHISQKGDGSIDFYISSKKDENWPHNSGIDFSDRLQLQVWFRNEFLGWSTLWFELFDQVTLPLLVRPQYYVPLDQSWEAQSNITLLGDAAHLMPPSGEGVNLAMLDALTLSECLTSDAFENTQSAIASYENQMRIRAAAEVRISLDTADWMHSDDATQKVVDLFKED